MGKKDTLVKAGLTTAGAAVLAAAPPALAVAGVALTVLGVATAVKDGCDRIAAIHDHGNKYPTQIQHLKTRLQNFSAHFERFSELAPDFELSKAYGDYLDELIEAINTFIAEKHSAFRPNQFAEVYNEFNIKLDKVIAELASCIQLEILKEEKDGSAERKESLREIKRLVKAAQNQNALLQAMSTDAVTHYRNLKTQITQASQAAANAATSTQQGIAAVDGRAQEQLRIMGGLKSELAEVELLIKRYEREFQQLGAVPGDVQAIIEMLRPPEVDHDQLTIGLRKKLKAMSKVELIGGRKVKASSLYIDGQLRREATAVEPSQVEQQDDAMTDDALIAGLMGGGAVSDEVTLAQVFADTGEGVRVRCRGSSGTGKSIQVKQFLELWLHREVGRQFQYVIPVDVKKLIVGKKYGIPELLYEVVFYEMFVGEGKDAAVAAARAFWEHVDRKTVLFVIEGVGETTHESVPWLLDEMVSAFVIGRENLYLPRATQEITVRPFEPQQIEEFVDKFFSNAQGNIGNLKEQLQSPQVKEIAKVPLFLQFICELWRESSETLFSEGRFSIHVLLSKLVEKIIRRFVEGRPNVADARQLREQIKKLASCVAYDSYAQENIVTFDNEFIRRVISTIPDVPEERIPDFRGSGLLRAIDIAQEAVANNGADGAAEHKEGEDAGDAAEHKEGEDAGGDHEAGDGTEDGGADSSQDESEDEASREVSATDIVKFFHDGIREHLAGDELASRMSSGSPDIVSGAQAYIERNKFNLRFLPVLEHAAASLVNDLPSLNLFFKTLLSGQRDLNGSYEFRVLVTCANACGWPEDLEVRKDILSVAANYINRFVIEDLDNKWETLFDNCLELLLISDYVITNMSTMTATGARKILENNILLRKVTVLNTQWFGFERSKNIKNVISVVGRSLTLLLRLPGGTETPQQIFEQLYALNSETPIADELRRVFMKTIIRELARSDGGSPSTLQILSIVRYALECRFSPVKFGLVWPDNITVPDEEVDQVVTELTDGFQLIGSDFVKVLRANGFCERLVFSKAKSSDVLQAISDWLPGFIDEHSREDNFVQVLLSVLRMLKNLELSSDAEQQRSQLFDRILSGNRLAYEDRCYISNVLDENGFPVSPAQSYGMLLKIGVELASAKAELYGGSQTIHSGVLANVRGMFAFLCRLSVPVEHEGEKEVLVQKYQSLFSLEIPGRIASNFNAAAFDAQAVQQGTDLLPSLGSEKLQGLQGVLTQYDQVNAGQFFTDEMQQFDVGEWFEVVNLLLQQENAYLHALAQEVTKRFHSGFFLENLGVYLSARAQPFGDYGELWYHVVVPLLVGEHDIERLMDELVRYKNHSEAAAMVGRRLKLSPEATPAFLQALSSRYHHEKDTPMFQSLCSEGFLERLPVAEKLEEQIADELCELVDRAPEFVIKFVKTHRLSANVCEPLINKIMLMSNAELADDLNDIADFIQAWPPYFNVVIQHFGEQGMNMKLANQVLFMRFLRHPEMVVCRMTEEGNQFIWYDADNAVKLTCAHPGKLAKRIEKINSIEGVPCPETMAEMATRTADKVSRWSASLFGTSNGAPAAALPPPPGP